MNFIFQIDIIGKVSTVFFLSFSFENKNIFFARECQFTSVDSSQRLRGAKVGLHFTLSGERNEKNKCFFFVEEKKTPKNCQPLKLPT